jgi:hypothetical protein
MIYHQASGERLATLWLKRPGDDEFHVRRVATKVRLFDSIHAAIEYMYNLDPAEFEAYRIVAWTPQVYASGYIT